MAVQFGCGDFSTAAAYPSFYTDEQSRLAYALTMKNPAMIAMLGPVMQ
ncbi:MAG: hypothetical protein RJR35_05830 [Thermoanaerobacterales bacterium]|nr:hypothetical protein [Thermoanaerobacterales bacterium]